LQLKNALKADNEEIMQIRFIIVCK